MNRVGALLLLCTACGEAVVGPSADAGAELTALDSASEAHDSFAEGRLTTCTAADGLAVCGGSARCEASDGCNPVAPTGLLGSCDGSAEPCLTEQQYPAGEVGVGCALVPDGDICIYRGLFAPFDLGALMADNGNTAVLSYADHGIWTGASLPIPSSCPAAR